MTWRDAPGKKTVEQLRTEQKEYLKGREDMLNDVVRFFGSEEAMVKAAQYQEEMGLRPPATFWIAELLRHFGRAA